MVTDGGMNPDVREVVRECYGEIARDMEAEGCCAPRSSCCSSGEKAGGLSLKLGYSPEELQSLPEGADLGLGNRRHYMNEKGIHKLRLWPILFKLHCVVPQPDNFLLLALPVRVPVQPV